MVTEIRQLTCDLCGHSELIHEAQTTVARIAGQKRGWKFMAYQGLATAARNSRNRPISAKQIDACPACDLPTPDELVKFLEAKANATDGQ